MTVHAKCYTCGFEVTYELKLNEHGLYEVPDGHCPNDFFVLDQVIMQDTWTDRTIKLEDK